MAMQRARSSHAGDMFLRAPSVIARVGFGRGHERRISRCADKAAIERFWNSGIRLKEKRRPFQDAQA